MNNICQCWRQNNGQDEGEVEFIVNELLQLSTLVDLQDEAGRTQLETLQRESSKIADEIFAVFTLCSTGVLACSLGTTNDQVKSAIKVLKGMFAQNESDFIRFDIFASCEH